ncbi:RNA methyltransferase [soil metagenome]
MPPQVIQIASMDDPRVAPYRDVKDRQLLPQFVQRRGEDSVRKAGEDGPRGPGMFMAEGEVVVRMLLRSTYRTVSMLCTPKRWEDVRDEVEHAAAGATVYVAEPPVLEGIVGFHLHRGLLALGERRDLAAAADLMAACEPGRPLVVLEDLTNHDNIGGVFRCAAALGAAGVILSPRCGDPLYRKALRVSVGCALAVPWTFAQEWPGTLGACRTAGLTVAGLALGEGTRVLKDVAADLRGRRVALVLGSEGPGLTAGALGACEVRVLIPMIAGVDSLNVATTAGIALYEFGCGNGASPN